MHWTKFFAINLYGVESLLWQARLAQKEESCWKYQELLKSAKDDIQQIHQHYQKELLDLQEQLHAKKDTQFKQFKQFSEQDLNSQRTNDAIPTTEQVNICYTTIWGC